MYSLRSNFMGAKMALFVGSKLLCLHRDDRPGLVWPDAWDFPGGGREEGETPVACILRETQEEFGLTVPASHIRWGRSYTNSIGRTVWFFVGWMPAQAEKDVRFGDEGQGWALLSVDDFAAHPKSVPQLSARLKEYQMGVVGECFTERPPAN